MLEMDGPHATQASHQHHEASPQMGPPKEKGIKRGRPRNTWRRDLDADAKKTGHTWRQLERPGQRRLERPGDSWRYWPRTQTAGETLSVAYVPGGAMGIDR